MGVMQVGGWVGGFWPASHHAWALFDIHAKPQDLDVAYVSKVIENPCKSCIFMHTPIQSLIYAFLLQILAYSLIFLLIPTICVAVTDICVANTDIIYPPRKPS